MTTIPAEFVDRVRARLQFLYGGDVERLLDRLLVLLGRRAQERIGRAPPSSSLWNQRDTVLITYGDSILAEDVVPLQALKRFADSRLLPGIGLVHVLPFCPYSSDDGFSVIDYREVRPDLGEWADLRALGEPFDLMFDLVLNHVSTRSAWFRDYLRGIAPARDYFIEASPSEDLLAVVRPRSLPLLTAVQTPEGERCVWTTFSADQVDVNFANPDVLFEYLDILLYYLEQGMRIIRLDAIAYLWKRVGTSCIHLPETHEVVKLFRDVLDLVAPEAILLTETNVPHQENIAYFGDGDEARMIYQFSLPPLVLHALHCGHGRYLTDWAATLTPPPWGCTYLNFTASHDGIGVRPLQGLLPDEELWGLLDAMRQRGGHISTKKNSDGTESPYEMNITYFDALADPGIADPTLHIERFLASQTIAMSLRGVPAIYIHSLTATRNDVAGVRATGRARTINRKQWREAELNARLDDLDSSEHRVFTEFIRRLQRRREQPAFHPDAGQQVLRLDDRLFGIVRRRVAEGVHEGGQTLVCLTNLTDQAIEVGAAACPEFAAARSWMDLLAVDAQPVGLAPLRLDPYQTVWLQPEA